VHIVRKCGPNMQQQISTHFLFHLDGTCFNRNEWNLSIRCLVKKYNYGTRPLVPRGFVLFESLISSIHWDPSHYTKMRNEQQFDELIKVGILTQVHVVDFDIRSEEIFGGRDGSSGHIINHKESHP
jgi:hypothetical protein